VLFSAGFDAHKNDPLAQLHLKSEDFYELTKRTIISVESSCNRNVVSILEGGYDLNALAESANEHVKALLEYNK
jgi:acetoin utilization deacetylase AcuC-like enzyme